MLKANRWILALFAFFIALPVLAANEQDFHGYLIDRSCRASVEGDSISLNFVKAQTRECALMPACRKAGYAIFSKGKWLNLDSKGNLMAVQYLEKTHKTKAFYVSVKGTLQNQTILTRQITELSEPHEADKHEQEPGSNAGK